MVRVRFAPSPTGPLHMGGVRTALYNYLFARGHEGRMILRIEDTDQARFVPGAEEYIMESLEWCGIRFDEGIREGGAYGPYRQSERTHIYRQYADRLVENGWAYYAFDTGDELEGRRLKAQGTSKDEESGIKEQGAFAYDSSTRMGLRNSLALGEQEVKGLLDSGAPYVIRFKMPAGEEIVMQDIIRGEVRVDSNTLDDKVLFKSDGMPTYHLANVVDDHLMEITHVIRGEEWLPSLPLHVMLYKAFGWTGTMPQFAHLPLILKPGGSGKLSKRDGDRMGFPVFPIDWTHPDNGEIYSGYREAGYFPEAFINILALLGWNDGTDKELYTMEELVRAFSLDRVGKSGSRFDPDKARWFNHQYMLNKGDEEIAKEFLRVYGPKVLRAYGPEGLRSYGPEGIRAYGPEGKEASEAEWDRLVKIISLVKERAGFVKDLWDHSWFFFEAPGTYDEATIKKRWTPETPQILKDITSLLIPYASQAPSALRLEELIKGYIADNGLNTGQVMNVLRLCLVGAPMGPGVFDIMEILGPEEVTRRIKRAIEAIG